MSVTDYNKLGYPKLTASKVVLTMYDGWESKKIIGQMLNAGFQLLSYEVEPVRLVEVHNKLTKDQIVQMSLRGLVSFPWGVYH